MQKAAFMIPLVAGLFLSGCVPDMLPRPSALDTPITLRVGETAQVGPERLEITLRSMSEHSGCFSPKDCSYMIFDGTLALVLGDKRDLFQIQADLGPGDPVTSDFGSYKVKIVSVTGPRNLTATFQVEKQPEGEEESSETH